MKKTFSRKLRSETGASLSFALLLFLVCAIIGVIILTAGTIASGRLAEKAKMDQRYYRVISAAEFLKDELTFKDELSGKDQAVSIIRTRKESRNPTSVQYYLWHDLDGNGEMDIDKELISDITNYDFLTENALTLLGTKTSNETMWNSEYYYGSTKTDEYIMNVQDESSSKLFSVKVKTVLKNNLMEIYISNINDDATDSDDYTLKMTLTPDISEVYSKAEIEEDSVPKIVETKKTTIRWIVNDIEKVIS